MMRQSFSTLCGYGKKSLPVLAVLALLMACSEDPANDARTQIFDSLTLTPPTVAAGDSVTGVVSYKDAGHSIYRVDYSYSITGRDEEGKIVSFGSGAWSVIDPVKQQPVFGFRAPTVPGIYTVTASSTRVNFSTGGPNGELYGAGSSASTTLIVTVQKSFAEF